jgi:hypothetical protein
MARFFFHLVDGEDVLLDPEGVEIARDDIAASALRQARSLISSDARDGEIQLSYRIEVKDGVGEIVHVLAFEDAVTIEGSPSAVGA